MKNLDLNAMGVQEMNVSEMKKVNGGSPFGLLLIAAGIIALIYIFGGGGVTVFSASN
jgi:hypothetical protein